MVANGDRVPNVSLCEAMPLQIGKEHFIVDCYYLSLGWFRCVGRPIAPHFGPDPLGF